MATAKIKSLEVTFNRLRILLEIEKKQLEHIEYSYARKHIDQETYVQLARAQKKLIANLMLGTGALVDMMVRYDFKRQ